MFGKKFVIFSIFIIVLTGIGIIFFDQSDDTNEQGLIFTQPDSSLQVSDSLNKLPIDSILP